MGLFTNTPYDLSLLRDDLSLLRDDLSLLRVPYYEMICAITR